MSLDQVIAWHHERLTRELKGGLQAAAARRAFLLARLYDLQARMLGLA